METVEITFSVLIQKERESSQLDQGKHNPTDTVEKARIAKETLKTLFETSGVNYLVQFSEKRSS